NARDARVTRNCQSPPPAPCSAPLAIDRMRGSTLNSSPPHAGRGLRMTRGVSAVSVAPSPRDGLPPEAFEASPANMVVVDDDATMRSMVAEFLQEHSVPAVAAAGRQELFRCFAGGDPSLIILDLQLGQDDGLELLREIRGRSDVPVIVMTGHRRDEI